MPPSTDKLAINENLFFFKSPGSINGGFCIALIANNCLGKKEPVVSKTIFLSVFIECKDVWEHINIQQIMIHFLC